MGRIISSFCFIFTAFLLSDVALGEGSLFVSPRGAKVLKSKGGELLRELPPGAGLTYEERDGMYYRLSGTDAGAFVSIIAVRAKPKASLSGAVKRLMTADHKEDPRARSQAMGVRGLTADDNVSNASLVRPDLRTLYRLEGQDAAPGAGFETPLIKELEAGGE